MVFLGHPAPGNLVPHVSTTSICSVTKANSISGKKGPNYYQCTSLLSGWPCHTGNLNGERVIMV